MRNIKMLLAGKRNDSEQVFFMSNHRQNAKRKTVFHNNDLSSIYTIPEDFFKQNFKYCAASGVYSNLNNVRYGDIAKYREIISHK